MKIPHYSRPFRESAAAGLVLLALCLAPASAATFTVLNTNDSGAGSLRQAIADAAASAGSDTIHFDAALNDQTITLSSNLLIFDTTGSVTIDGKSGCATPNGVTVSGGGAVRILTVQAGSTATLRSLKLINGNTTDEGGGIYNGGVLTLMECAIENCAGSGGGGGIRNSSGASVVFERCTVSGNTAGFGLGGGIWNSGTCVVRSSTISGNTAGLGGGIYHQSGMLKVESSTIAANSANNIGGGIRVFGFGLPFGLENSIVADNTAGTSPDLAGQVTIPAGRNLVEDPTGASGLAGDLIGIDPQLGPLADNGGPTSTHLPATGSPVVDAGIPTVSTSAIDQRFFARQVDQGDPDGDGEILDIGAVEVGAAGGAGQVAIVNPADDAGGFGVPYRFGTTVTVLPNGNFAVTDPDYDFSEPSEPDFVPNVGAVYLYDVSSLQLISTLTGASAEDRVGSGGIRVLANGNFLIASPDWSSGPADGAGAVTWGNATSGVSGAVSEANSLVGSSASDQVGVSGSFGEIGITALDNGNYVVTSIYWDNGAANAAGAVTWGDGTTGVSGPVSAANSLVGSSQGNLVGSGGVMVLTNGNYVVRSHQWDNGAATDAGAVTWGDGATGVSGPVSAANSLVGSSPSDFLGFRGVVALSNGNYVVTSRDWDNGAAVDAGAVTWGDGSTGVSGLVSAANSLVGSSGFDVVGSGEVIVLTNGNYVVRSSNWDNGAVIDAGAVTWGDGTTGVRGAVSAANSLVGSSAADRVGSVAALANGNYVVVSRNWDDGATADVGAVTWVDGATGVSGPVSAANSLMGSSAGDKIGFVTALTNGNYVVHSSDWDDGATVDVGAVRWANGGAGLVGVVSAANSLVGSNPADRVGGDGVTALANGNYVVRSRLWDDGATADVGAVTWGNGGTGLVGVVNAANSLVGSSANDRVGTGVTVLPNGNYVVTSVQWDNGAASDAGAVTWGDGTSGLAGVVSAANSLVGSTAGDRVGSPGVTALPNGNYVVRSSQWANGAESKAGAVTWGDGDTGVSGPVSAANSLVGTSPNDLVGIDSGVFGVAGVTPLTNGNYVVASRAWDNGTASDAGAVTWADGTTGVTGPVSAANSVVGSTTGDQVGTRVTALAEGDYVVWSNLWDRSGVANVGAMSLLDGVVGTGGTISASNSVLGTATNGGSAMVFEYDPVNARLIVGDPAGNLVTVMGYRPEIAVEVPSGMDVPNCGTAVLGAPLGAEGSRTFTIRNTNGGILSGLNLMIDGPDAALFTVTSEPADSVSAFGSTAFTVRFAPTSPGAKTAVLHISNNDPDEHPFDISLSGRVLVATDDSDGDGLNDVSEFELADLGFDWQTSQPDLVADLFGNLGDAVPNLNAEGFYTTSQVHDLYLGTPLIQGDLDVGTATLTMWIEKSENMVDFFPFPMTDPQTTINGLGQLEFDFPLTNGAAFFKLGTSGD